MRVSSWVWSGPRAADALRRGAAAGLCLSSGCTDLLGDVRVESSSGPSTQMLMPGPSAEPERGASARDSDAGAASPFELDAGAAPPALACERGDFRCDEHQLLYCMDGSAWVLWQLCDSAALCTSESPGRCLPSVCEPGEQRCDGPTLQRCNGDLNGWDAVETCASPAHCDPEAEACRTAPCELGQQRCNRGELQQCRADLLDWDVLQTCATQALCRRTLTQCEEAPASCEGQAIACEEPVCEADQKGCNGARLRQCNPGRAGFTLLEACASAELCEASAANGQASCMPPVCERRELRCSEGALERCGAGRAGFELVEQCASPALCNAAAGACELPACEAGSHECTAEGELLACNSDRTGYVSQSPPVVCDEPALCEAARGRCRRPAREK